MDEVQAVCEKHSADLQRVFHYCASLQREDEADGQTMSLTELLWLLNAAKMVDGEQCTLQGVLAMFVMVNLDDEIYAGKAGKEGTQLDFHEFREVVIRIGAVRIHPVARSVE